MTDHLIAAKTLIQHAYDGTNAGGDAAIVPVSTAAIAHALIAIAEAMQPVDVTEELDQATQRAEAAEADAAALRHQLAEVDAHIERLAARLGYPAPADEDTPA